MQLKLRRSQRIGGIVSQGVVFCIDARAEFTPEEQANLSRYKLYKEVIYNSEAQKRLLDKGLAHNDGSASGFVKSLATLALARTKLYVTVRSLGRGQHIECKSLDELLGAEEALMQACQNLKAYLETAQSFDGREVLYDFSGDTPRVVAHAVSPDPLLAVPGGGSPDLALPAPFDEYPADDDSESMAWKVGRAWRQLLSSEIGVAVRDLFGTSPRYAIAAAFVFLVFVLVTHV